MISPFRIVHFKSESFQSTSKINKIVPYTGTITVGFLSKKFLYIYLKQIPITMVPVRLDLHVDTLFIHTQLCVDVIR